MFLNLFKKVNKHLEPFEVEIKKAKRVLLLFMIGYSLLTFQIPVANAVYDPEGLGSFNFVTVGMLLYNYYTGRTARQILKKDFAYHMGEKLLEKRARQLAVLKWRHDLLVAGKANMVANPVLELFITDFIPPVSAVEENEAAIVFIDNL